MGLHDRELSPLSSNDIGGDKRSKSSNIPNHYNKSNMKRSVTGEPNYDLINLLSFGIKYLLIFFADTIREQLEGDIEMEMPIPNQKPAYIPSNCYANYSFHFINYQNCYSQTTRPGVQSENIGIHAQKSSRISLSTDCIDIAPKSDLHNRSR
jgi:hypothetical protein